MKGGGIMTMMLEIKPENEKRLKNQKTKSIKTFPDGRALIFKKIEGEKTQMKIIFIVDLHYFTEMFSPDTADLTQGGIIGNKLNNPILPERGWLPLHKTALLKSLEKEGFELYQEYENVFIRIWS